MPDRKRNFWIDVLEKLNDSDDIYKHIPVILENLCAFFSFGCAFVYEADHTSTLHLRERYCIYENSALRPELNLYDLLGPDLYEDFIARKSVIVKAGEPADELEKELAVLFDANALILLPILAQDKKAVAVIGIMDRRRERHLETEDVNFTYSVLATVASHIKLHLLQQQVELTDRSLKSIMDNMGVDIYVNDFYTHEVLYSNKSMAKPYGGVENLIGKICWQALYDDKTEACEFCPQKKLIDDEGHPTKVYSWDYQRPFDGAWFRVLSAAFNWTDGRLAHVVSSVDITENKYNEAVIRQLAEYDNLTRLPNRYKMHNDCDRMLAQPQESLYILFVDLDGFKKVNDHFGHRAGDELLQAIGSFLMSEELTRGYSYRYGGDEFVILLRGAETSTLRSIIDLLVNRLAEPWQLTDGSVVCQCSIGITQYPADAQDTSDLIHKADTAMYCAKRSGTGETIFYNQGNMIPAHVFFARAAQQGTP